MRSRRGALVAGVAMLSVPVVLASLAWACSPRKFASIEGPKVVAPGATVKVTGTAWEAGDPGISVLWVADGRSTTLRPTSSEKVDYLFEGRTVTNFTQTVKLPDTMQPGVKYELLVVGPPSPGNVANSWPLSVVTAGERVVEDPIAPPEDPTPPPTAPRTVTGTPTPAGAAAAPVAEDTSVLEPADAPAASSAPGRSVPDRSPGLPAGRTRTAAAPAAVALPAAPGAAAVGPDTAAPQPAVATEVAPLVPGARTTGSELWSGFSTGNDQRGASLAGDATVPGSSSNSMGAGLAVLGIGLVALLAGVGIALRKRPVKVLNED